MRTSLLVAALLFTAVLVVAGAAAPSPGADTAKATFAVHCYDVGAGALDGKPGVISVERGWSRGHEVDRVVYDPQMVSLGQLETYLKQANTYVDTLEHSPPAMTATKTAQ